MTMKAFRNTYINFSLKKEELNSFQKTATKAYI